MADRRQERRGTAAQWAAANPVLAAGEAGIETDAVPPRVKWGDGVKTWTQLSAVDVAKGAGAFSVAQTSIPTGVETVVPLASESFDTAGYHDPAVNNSRVTIPPGHGGAFVVAGSVAYNYVTPSPGVLTACIYLNGTKVAETGGVGTAGFVVNATYLGYLVPGDYLELATYQDSGVARTLQNSGRTRLTALRIGA